MALPADASDQGRRQISTSMIAIRKGRQMKFSRFAERLERMAPELGSSRVADAKMYVRAQTMVIELVGGQVAEFDSFPHLPSLGAQHDFVEATAFAGVACAASPAVTALLAYAESEAHALLSANTDILNDLVEALVACGTLSGDEVDQLIAHRVAMRSITAERKRRDDWRQREQRAAAFAASLLEQGI